MPTRRNPAYAGGFNDPSFAAAAAGLGQMFAPPSGTDAAGYANAAATKEKAARLADLWTRAQQPGFDPQKADALGVFGGLYNPNQSYYSVNEGNRVSVENNQRDNARAVTTTMLAPVAKDATRFVPPAVADLYQVPQMQAGVREYDQGKTYDVPTNAQGDTKRVAGPAKPLEIGQVQAQAFAALPPEMQQAIVAAGPGVENTVGADGAVVPMSRAGAVVAKAPIAPRERNAQVQNYRDANGNIGTAQFVDGKGWVDSQTRQPVPQGAITFSTNVTGDQLQTGVIKPTVANNSSANAQAANLDTLEQLVNAYGDLVDKNPGVVGLPGMVRGIAQDLGSVASEFAQAFGNMSPDAKLTAEQIQAASGRFAPSRDPSIQQARLMASDLAYKYAQAQNPSGEVSRQAFERALETLTGGVLRNNDSVRDSLGGMREFIARQRTGVNSLRNPTPVGGAPAPGAPAAPAAPQQFQEGQTATGQGGQKIIFRGGNWVPM